MPREQVIYEVNIDYKATYQNLSERPEVAVHEPQDGTMHVELKKTSWSPIIIWSTGKMQITFDTPEDHERLVEAIKPLLIPLPGEKLNFRMLRKIDLYDKKVDVYKLVKEMRDVLYEEKLREPELSFKVKNVVEELRHEYRFLREPSVKEVAIKVGKAPEIVRSLLYELAPETGWAEQEPEQEKKVAKESIDLAGWMKWLQKGDESGKYSPEQTAELNSKTEEEIQRATPIVKQRAESILKYYPELVPEAKPSEIWQRDPISGYEVLKSEPRMIAGLDPWPEETRRVWRHIFGEEAPRPPQRPHSRSFG